MTGEAIVKPGFDIDPEEDFSHAPTTRAAIDKERIEELEAQVEWYGKACENARQRIAELEAERAAGDEEFLNLRARIAELEAEREKEITPEGYEFVSTKPEMSRLITTLRARIAELEVALGYTQSNVRRQQGHLR